MVSQPARNAKTSAKVWISFGTTKQFGDFLINQTELLTLLNIKYPINGHNKDNKNRPTAI